jgi:hypothetical protein
MLLSLLIYYYLRFTFFIQKITYKYYYKLNLTLALRGIMFYYINVTTSHKDV